MTEQRSAGKIDFEVLRRAEEQRDLDAMLDLYADDAEVRIVDRTPSPARLTCCGARGR
jgi:hypothetical protein